MAGGKREIASPRLFLKTVQYWIKDYFLHDLKVHDTCHAYISGRSIQSNAKSHCGQDYVANIDIKDFFGSISTQQVISLLKRSSVGERLSSIIGSLLTLDNALPQGSPTSPIISNAFLYDFDKAAAEYCKSENLVYTRYADDMTISGNNLRNIQKAIEFIHGELKKYNLGLNDKKTRIASKFASQRVTGLIVNQKVLPPRKYRKKVRSIFHNAELKPKEYLDRVDELRGHISYLSSFEEISGHPSLEVYKKTIRKLKVIKNKLN